MATKNQLIASISAQVTHFPKEDVISAVDLILDYIKEELTKENRLEIRGFGSFSIRNRKTVGSDKLHKVIYYKMAKGCLKMVNDLSL